MPKWVVFGVIKSLHDLFTVLWVGGILTTLIIFLPVLRKTLGKQESLGKITHAYQNRLRIIAVISIIGLWITGALLARQSPSYSGFLQFSTPYSVAISVKHILVFLMIIISVVRGFLLGGKGKVDMPEKSKAALILLILNGILGIGVILLSGISAAMG
jgi:uncharacterized membrane protein